MIQFVYNYQIVLLSGGVSFMKMGNKLVCEDSFTKTEASIAVNLFIIVSLKLIEV